MKQANLQARPKISSDTPMGVDATLLLTFAILMLLGLTMVFSSTIALQDKSLQTNFSHFQKQTVFMLVGSVGAYIISFIPVQVWQRMSMPLLGAAILVMLILVFTKAGVEVNGSTRWISFGGFRIQPAEFVKLIMIVYMASYLTRRREQLYEFTRGILIIGVVLGIIAGLLLAQPDFGSFFVIACTVGLMMFLGGVRISHMLVCGTFVLIAIFFMVKMAPYRMQRVLSFRDPFADAYDTGYQLVHSLIAIGRGEFLGVGLGGSIQKLYYLPHAHNDFILAVIGEELGLLGIILVISLFILLLRRIFVIARRADDAGLMYGARLAQGIGSLLIIQAIVNIGVNLGVLPTKGLTLPFISYGGSSILVSCAAIGMVFAVDKQSKVRQVAPPRASMMSHGIYKKHSDPKISIWKKLTSVGQKTVKRSAGGAA